MKPVEVRFTRRVTVTAQFASMDEALDFVRVALEQERIVEPTVNVAPIVTSTATSRAVRYEAAVKGTVSVSVLEVPYRPPAAEVS